MMKGKEARRETNGRAGIVVVVVALVFACLVGFRIWQVNDSAFVIPVEHYSLGDTVELDGAFAENDYEQTDGYSIEVTKAEVMTPREYVQTYGKSSQALEDDIAEADDPCIIVLTLNMTNVGNEGGHFSALSWKVLSPEERSEQYSCDFDLWAYVEPMMGQYSCFELLPDSSYTTQVPFRAYRDPSYFLSYSEAYRPIVTAHSFEFIFTNDPVRKQVDFEVE